MGNAKKRGAVPKDVGAAVVERSSGRCEASYPVEDRGMWFVRRCQRGGDQIHHAKYRSRCGTGSNPENLLHMCVWCHQKADTDAWFARYRTRSYQKEGQFEIALWNPVSNLVKSVPAFKPIVDDLLFRGLPIAMSICPACGLLDVQPAERSCRNCANEILAWKNVTEEAKTYTLEMRI